MPSIDITNFQGELPGFNPLLLKDNQAQYAVNCDLATGVLKPFYRPSTHLTLTGLTDPRSIYKIVGDNGDIFWLTSTRGGSISL